MANSLLHKEQELLLQIAQGDEQSFKQLVEAFSPKLYNYIFRITRNQVIAEEVMQDIFVQIWQVRETFAEVKNFDAWLYVISRNHSINALEKMMAEKRRFLQWRQLSSPTEPVLEIVISPLTLIDTAVGKLPPQQQKIWVMNRRLRMKYQDIASQLGISKDTVNKHLRAATVSIKEFLNKHLDELIIIIFLMGTTLF